MTSRHAWLADVMWGLAMTATVPFVVGTAFLSAAARPAMAMAAVAAPMATAVAPAGEHDPCIGDPDSAECSEWLAQQVITMHEEI